MINNDVRKIGDFGNVVYDSGSDTPTGRKRIGISATEIELLDDLPPSSGNKLTSNANNVSSRSRAFDTQIPSSSTAAAATAPIKTTQNNYQTLSLNRNPANGNVVYQSGSDQQLNSAVDQLLEKYAPDAIPQNLIHKTNNPRSPTQVNVVTARDQPPASAFQTTTAPTSTATHNYSTIIRPNTGQKLPTQTNINDNNTQIPSRSRPTTNYDSFQHVVPPPQQQQQQQPQQQWQQSQQQQWQQSQQRQQQQQPQQSPQKSVPVRTKNGQFAHVIPGKVYTLDDDPLHLLYDRQPTIPSNPQNSSFTTVFQPTNKPQTVPNPSTVMYANTSQRYPQQPMTTATTTTTTNPNAQGVQAFDLENLIKRVQQEYLREIQPFVSSVKFVEKDREFGQSLADIGFVTPVTVRKGFSKQADDILRRSFGRRDRSQPSPSDRGENTYSEDEDEEEDGVKDLHASRYRRPLEKDDSKQSFTSVTSVSTTTSTSDYDEKYKPGNVSKNKVEMSNQATSPPTQYNQTKPDGQNIIRTSIDIPPKHKSNNESEDEEDTTTASGPSAPVRPARRVGSDEFSDTSSDATMSDNDEDRRATYNEHDSPARPQDNPTNAIHALAANVPVMKPDENIRERIMNADNLATQRSEDIHPVAPTINVARPSTNPDAREDDDEKSNGRESASEEVSESEEEESSAAAYNQPPQLTQSSAAARPTVPETPPTAPLTRGPTTPPANARFPGAPAGSNAPSTSQPNPTNNTRQPGSTGPNSNLHFIPPDQRSAANNRGGPQPTSTVQPAPVTESVATGSGRFFQSDNTPRSGAKRGSKEAPTTIGNKIKSFFRRKNAD